MAKAACTTSSSLNGESLCTGVVGSSPRCTGIESMWIAAAWPSGVTKKSVWWEFVRKILQGAFSPPRRLGLSSSVRLINPSALISTQKFSSGITSVWVKSCEAFSPSFSWIIRVRRASAYLLFSSVSSSITTWRIFWDDLSKALRFLIASLTCLYSSSIFMRSSEANRFSGISKMAFAWISSKFKRFIKFWRASSVVLALRISWITKSMFLIAIRKASKICRRASFLLSSNSLRRRTTSKRCSANTRKLCLSVNRWGLPSTSASRLTRKVLCMAVRL